MTKRRTNKKASMPQFIEKLVEILDEQQLTSVITWNPVGDGFFIKNTSQFTDVVLPNYFKHHNFSSFIRQLNMYGFSKNPKEDIADSYSHPFFIKNRKQLLLKIKRKLQAKHQDQLDDENCKKLYRDLKYLKARQDDIERKFTISEEHYAKISKQNQQLIHILLQNQNKSEAAIYQLKKNLDNKFSKIEQTYDNNQSKTKARQYYSRYSKNSHQAQNSMTSLDVDDQLKLCPNLESNTAQTKSKNTQENKRSKVVPSLNHISQQQIKSSRDQILRQQNNNEGIQQYLSLDDFKQIYNEDFNYLD